MARVWMLLIVSVLKYREGVVDDESKNGEAGDDVVQ